eukprot:CAMPEP_0170598374 /NCGR_PEP_ID=MMETSP0224-20130122/16214_1 /TAXON_ID=285029 /ORGANISM="Togula jolla, Strain CCCM 725" /LENGTH=41 /DNA_ID= /DNA_START= /DNA_END= /DNA_ORIENTATION=
MAVAMKSLVALLLLAVSCGATLRTEQDPCAGCDESLAYSYQ